MLVMRTRPSLVLPIAVATWGMITCLEAAAKSYTHLVILRIFMGILESALTPASITMLSCWYRPAEQSRRALLYTSSVTVGGAFGGLLAGGITGSLEGAKGLRGWQWLFLVEGSITIVWAVFCVFLIPDTPENSTRFTPRQKHIAQMRLRGVGTASPTGKHNGEKKLGKLQSLKLACLDWRVYLVTLATTVCSPPPFFLFSFCFVSFSSTFFPFPSNHYSFNPSADDCTVPQRFLHPSLLLPHASQPAGLQKRRNRAVHDGTHLRGRLPLGRGHCHPRRPRSGPSSTTARPLRRLRHDHVHFPPFPRLRQRHALCPHRPHGHRGLGDSPAGRILRGNDLPRYAA